MPRRVNRYHTVTVANPNDPAEIARASALALQVAEAYNRPLPAVALLLPGFARPFRTEGHQRRRGVAPLTSPYSRLAEQTRPMPALSDDYIQWRIAAPLRDGPPPGALIVDPWEVPEPPPFPPVTFRQPIPAHVEATRIRLTAAHVRPHVAAAAEAYDAAGRDLTR